MAKAIQRHNFTESFPNNLGHLVAHSGRKHLRTFSTYLKDPIEELRFFDEILQDPSLTEEEKQKRLIDLSRINFNDFNKKDKKKSQVGRVIGMYTAFVKQTLPRVKEVQAEYLDVKVFNAKRFFAEINPFLIVETITSVVGVISSALLGSKGGTSPYLPRTKVVRDLARQALRLAKCKMLTTGGLPRKASAENCKQEEALFFGKKPVTPKLEGEIGLVFYDFCERWKLVKTFNNEELGISAAKSGKPGKKGFQEGKRWFTEVETLPLPPQHIAYHFPRILQPTGWYRYEGETTRYRSWYSYKGNTIEHKRRCYKERGTPSRENTISKERSLSINIHGGASVEVKLLSFPSPIREHEGGLFASKSEDFFLTISSENLPIINRLESVPMRVDDRLLDYVIEWCEQLAERGLLQPISLATRNITAEIEGLREGLKGLSKEEEDKFKKEIGRTRLEYNKARTQWYGQRMTIGVADILRRRPLYLKAFLDFRGRLYRRSILSPQSSSLARALMIFDHTAAVNCSNAHLFASHIGFAFKRFVTFDESSQWVAKNIRQIIDLHQQLFYMEDGNRV